MSRGPALISRLLDWLQGIGQTPGVNPERPKNGQLPPVVPPAPALGLVAWACITVASLTLILLVALFGPPTSGGFIYEQF
ncbi:MAG: hypothetical protein Q3997_05370 [Propionibacteriaceae bacterium]|nr:hypothetical protein [Propionibacteriaceae bacterium]